MQLTLTQLFGEGANQTLTTLTIEKSSLYGLTASSSNRAEQLLAAIINTAVQAFSGYLEDNNGVFITSETGGKLDYKNIYSTLNLFWWESYFQKQKIISSAIIQFLGLYAD